MSTFISITPLILGWLLDLLLGDPSRLPHPVVAFGKAIAVCERRLNRGRFLVAKGAVVAVALIAATFLAAFFLLKITPNPYLKATVETVIVFYCLAGTTLIREVRAVFRAADQSLEKSRAQVARIVGRDTANLSPHEVRTAALETLAENLSDGVVAPLFWYALLGAPGMLAYKMVNTLDSMLGYRTPRLTLFGRAAARIDDLANLIPARITAILMLLVAARINLLPTVMRNGRLHLSPNSGYPEAALAAILDCQFGGSHDYFGQTVHKPHIGTNPRPLTTRDMHRATRINRAAEALALSLVLLARIVC